MSVLVDIILVLIATGSLAATAVMVWYVRKVLLKMAMLVDRNKEIANEIEEYTEHLETVYGLETFYGDETLKGLLSHTKTLSDNLRELGSEVLYDYEGEEEQYESE